MRLPARVFKSVYRRSTALVWRNGGINALPFGDRIGDILKKRSLKRGNTSLLVPPEELDRFFRDAIGDLSKDQSGLGYFEAGVFAGQSMAVWWHACQDLGIESQMCGADSFAGLPYAVATDEGGWKPGAFYCPRPITEWNLARLGVPIEDVRLVEGWFDQTLTPELAESVGTVDVAMLDADAYSSTVPVLDFLTGILADRAWIVFDDWFSGGNYDAETETSLGTGVERAFSEWLASAGNRWKADPMGTYAIELGGRKQMAGKVFRLDAAASNLAP